MTPIIFRPDEKYQSKLYISVVLTWALAFAWWSIPLVYIGGYELGGVGLGIAAATIIHGAALALSLWPVEPYYRSIRYELHDDEVIVYAGIITKSVKHVPFRTVTNLKVTRGPLDRMFGLGSLAIQTAGMSGTTGAEENLVGLINVQEIYDQIVVELRRFRGALSPTQTDQDVIPATAPANGQAAALNQQTLSAILDELRAIRQGLKNE